LALAAFCGLELGHSPLALDNRDILNSGDSVRLRRFRTTSNPSNEHVDDGVTSKIADFAPWDESVLSSIGWRVESKPRLIYPHHTVPAAEPATEAPLKLLVEIRRGRSIHRRRPRQLPSHKGRIDQEFAGIEVARHDHDRTDALGILQPIPKCFAISGVENARLTQKLFSTGEGLPVR
jgi:hypothetical protein